MISKDFMAAVLVISIVLGIVFFSNALSTPDNIMPAGKANVNLHVVEQSHNQISGAVIQLNVVEKGGIQQ